MKTEHPLTSTPKRMTRKEALAMLFRLREQWVEEQTMEQFQVAAAMRDDLYDAFEVLMKLVFGPRRSGQFGLPCKVCYQRYAEQIVHEQGKCISTWCCTPCRDRLREEGQLVEDSSSDEAVACSESEA